jgi:AP endonuclease-1
MVDAWRHFHPTLQRFTYFSYRFQCRNKNLGWRLDYFIVSPSLMSRITSCEIREEAYGASDHVPLLLTVE